MKRINPVFDTNQIDLIEKYMKETGIKTRAGAVRELSLFALSIKSSITKLSDDIQTLRDQQGLGQEDAIFYLLRCGLQQNGFSHIVSTYTIDDDGYITYISSGFGQKLGYRPGEVIGKHISKIIEPDSWRKILDEYADQYYRTGYIVNMPVVYIKKDGSLLNCLITVSADYDINSKRIGGMAYVKECKS